MRGKRQEARGKKSEADDQNGIEKIIVLDSGPTAWLDSQRSSGNERTGFLLGGNALVIVSLFRAHPSAEYCSTTGVDRSTACLPCTYLAAS